MLNDRFVQKKALATLHKSYEQVAMPIDDNLKVDVYNHEITQLFHGEIVDFTKYNEPAFLCNLKARALSGIQFIITKINNDALLSDKRYFYIDQEMRTITLCSKQDPSGLYIKASVNDAEHDLNLLEYAIISGHEELSLNFAQFGVVSDNLVKLYKNLLAINNNIDNTQVKLALESLIKALAVGAQKYEMSDNNSYVNPFVQICYSEYKTVCCQLFIFIVGAVLLIVGIVFNIQDIAKVFTAGIGGALIAAAVQNTAILFMNTVHENIQAQLALHKEQATDLFHLVTSLRISNDGQLMMQEFVDNMIKLSPPVIQKPIISASLPSDEPDEFAAMVRFSSKNFSGLGLNTNSDSNSNLELNNGNPNKLRTFHPEME